MKHLLLTIGSLLVVLAALYVYPWKLQWQQQRTVTVTGTAQSQVSNEVARFNAGVNAVNDKKETAMDEVNGKVTALIESVKQFGVADKDIKTQNMNIYQNQESYYEDGRQKQRLGQWTVNNTIEITLRDTKRAQELTTLLSQSGANNVYGPNFTLDDQKEASADLVQLAIQDARSKAETMAKAGGAKVGKVLVINDGGTSSGGVVPMFAKGMGGGGGAAPVESGSTTVSRSVTVTFELN